MSHHSAPAGIYREQIIDHYRHPRNFGWLDACQASRRESNFSCGDDLSFCLEISGQRVTDIRFNGTGCALSVAAASMLTEKVRGASLDEVERLGPDDVVALLGVGQLTGSRLRCATLGLKGIQTALAEWRAGQNQS